MIFIIQVIKGVSATKSGICTLPIVHRLADVSIISRDRKTKIGYYYAPVMLISPRILAAGQDLISTLKVDETSKRWVRYQSIAGFGLG